MTNITFGLFAMHTAEQHCLCSPWGTMGVPFKLFGD